jgi:hypothetical protein
MSLNWSSNASPGPSVRLKFQQTLSYHTCPCSGQRRILADTMKKHNSVHSECLVVSPHTPFTECSNQTLSTAMSIISNDWLVSGQAPIKRSLGMAVCMVGTTCSPSKILMPGFLSHRAWMSLLFYERMAAGEEDVVTKDVQVGDGATVTGDTTEKAISISSGIEESSDEEDSSDEDEVSDEDMFGDEEDLHIDYGYGPADPEELAAQARQYLEDLSDDELDSQVSSDEEDDTDDDIDVDFEDLIPEAQAEEIAAVYQHIAVLLTGDAKADLLANAKQVLMAGSMLAKSLRKQEQGDDYESSAESSDVEMLDQTTPEAHTSEHKDKLQIFKGLPAYVKGIWLAKGAEDASNLLQKDAHNVDNVDIVRRLHLYAGRAIRLCKQLHEADSPPHDDNPALYESMPSLRGCQRGLRLGAVYRGHANFLLETKRNDNASDLCNLFLCGSYVTEMGWQLDDLQAAQTEHDSTVTALETRNKTLGARNGTLETQNTTLQAQVDQLQEQLQALKIENAAARPDASAALSGPELYEQLRKFLVPEQATTGDRDQMMDTSDTLVGDVASDMPAVQVQQDVDMTGTAGSPPDVLPNTPAKDPKPGPKSDPKISSTVSLPAASEHVDSEVDTSVAPKPVSKLDAFHEARGLSFDDLHAKTSPHPNGKGKAPSPSKAAGSPTKASTKQPKGGVPSFMSTTAATAAESRAPMSKPGATAETRPQTSAAIRPTTRPSTRAATRAGTRADDQASVRPETPIEQSASRGQPAPATREEPHRGGRRRIGHVPDVIPPSPSATPTKKQRKAGAKKGGK